ncbi:MAG: hypothetical protein P4M11_15760 [Candidatus Pacebacteria bacterium]|nr:hypothetical protein [Candidatus Paceibacterota bacterium]
MDNLELTRTLLNLMCSEESERLNSTMPLILRLANRLLASAMSSIQNQFYEEFQANPKSERLFERMHGMISRNIFIYFRHSDKFALDYSDEGDGLLAKIDVQAEILKLLKSLCENHNSNLQCYMTDQKYSRNKYGMIAVIIDYLNVLVLEIRTTMEGKVGLVELSRESKKIRMKMSYKHSVLAIKALIEFVQGPCHENQEEISNTSFYLIAEDILKLGFLFPDSIKEYQRDMLNNHQISKLKKLCAILLLSLMEQRSNEDPIVTKMQQCLTETSLTYNLNFVYFAFCKESDHNYTEELLFPVPDRSLIG